MSIVIRIGTRQLDYIQHWSNVKEEAQNAARAEMAQNGKKNKYMNTSIYGYRHREAVLLL